MKTEVKTDMPAIGEVWGYEGSDYETLEGGEYGYFVVSNIGGKLMGMGEHCESPSDERRAKSFDRCLIALEKTWLATVPDTWEPSNNTHPYLYVATSEKRALA